MVLAAAAVTASVAGIDAQLLFAAAVVGTVGLAHGASDVAVVSPVRRGFFLALYLLLVAASLAAWRLVPGWALAAFLVLSTAHFLAEEPAASRAERWCRALLPVTAPAVFHRDQLVVMFEQLGAGPLAAGLLCPVGLAIAALLPAAVRAAWLRGAAAPLLLGAAAALLLPPLTGFAVAFTVLHAWPQLGERIAETRSEGLTDYLARHRLVLAGSALLIGAAALLFADHLRLLFAALAAFAIPHMVLTPRFSRD